MEEEEEEETEEQEEEVENEEKREGETQSAEKPWRLLSGLSGSAFSSQNCLFPPFFVLRRPRSVCLSVALFLFLYVCPSVSVCLIVRIFLVLEIAVRNDWIQLDCLKEYANRNLLKIIDATTSWFCDYLTFVYGF